MLVSFECTVVGQRLRNLKELRSMATPKQSVQVYRSGKWELLPGEALLVGDIISIGRPPAGAGHWGGGEGDRGEMGQGGGAEGGGQVRGGQVRGWGKAVQGQAGRGGQGVLWGRSGRVCPAGILPWDERCGRWLQDPHFVTCPPCSGPGGDEKVVPADCLLLSGSCIVEEAVLTGESTPQWKVRGGGGFGRGGHQQWGDRV